MADIDDVEHALANLATCRAAMARVADALEAAVEKLTHGSIGEASQ